MRFYSNLISVLSLKRWNAKRQILESGENMRWNSWTICWALLGARLSSTMELIIQRNPFTRHRVFKDIYSLHTNSFLLMKNLLKAWLVWEYRTKGSLLSEQTFTVRKGPIQGFRCRQCPDSKRCSGRRPRWKRKLYRYFWLFVCFVQHSFR